MSVFKRGADGVPAGAGSAGTDVDAFGSTITLTVGVDAVADTASDAADVFGYAFVVLMFHSLKVPFL